MIPGEGSPCRPVAACREKSFRWKKFINYNIRKKG